MPRDFDLPEDDKDGLAAAGRPYETVAQGGAKWLLLPGYPVPTGYNVAIATAALRLPPSYPDDQIDMVFFDPPLSLASGRTINNLSIMQIDGRAFQQWSRHRTVANPWRPGLDGVCTHLLQVDSWLLREVR